MTNLDDFLGWSEPDNGCAACGKPHVTVAEQRCADCLESRIRYCPKCLDDIGAVIDREVVRRLRQASHDVNDTWVQGDYFDRIRARERVLDARRNSGGTA